MPKDIQSIEDLLVAAGTKTSIGSAPTGTENAQQAIEQKLHAVRLQEIEQETSQVAADSGIPYVNLKGFPISPEALQQIPEDQASAKKTLCFLYSGTEVRLASTNPTSEEAKQLLFSVTERLKANGKLYQISNDSFESAFTLYKSLPKIHKIVKGVKVTDKELAVFQEQIHNYADVQTTLASSNITDTLVILMAAAIKLNSSDIRIEAEESGIAIRFRVDGILQDVATLPREEWKQIVSRIKLISGLKINVTDRPQDGRFTIYLKTGDTDVRVSMIPTAWGESVVMRLLRPSAIAVEFSQLGWRENMKKALTREIEKPHGMIITTGPTGSGKTTTLYAILRYLNKPGVKIITLEDPVEYKLEGINQSQIDHKKEYTFAAGLRSILRQDPDVVMVGEIRDLETADVAINAALTGHLMLSTLHTNDASGALPRFIAMGVKPFLIAPSLNAIIGQRLIRKIHEDCKEEIKLDEESLARVKKIVSEIPPAAGETILPESEWKFYHGKGCAVCNDSGYKGRIGAFELLLMTDTIRGALSENLSEYKMRELAIEQGMITMVQDGILKALDGSTTVEEVLRVVGE